MFGQDDYGGFAVGRTDHGEAGRVRREARRDAREKRYGRSIPKVTCQDDGHQNDNISCRATGMSLPEVAHIRGKMKSTIVIAAILTACLAQAKEPKHYQSGTLLQMDSAECGFDENSGKSLVGELVGTDSAHKKTHAMLCQEYLLQSDKVIYRIRPKDEKHPVLLPVGERAQFRIHKDKMLLRAEDLDDKEREYLVVSMTPRQTKESAENILSK